MRKVILRDKYQFMSDVALRDLLNVAEEPFPDVIQSILDERNVDIVFKVLLNQLCLTGSPDYILSENNCTAQIT